ncbi:MAG: hypothetical protein RL701_4353 [Pseudomonadota bacterium]
MIPRPRWFGTCALAASLAACATPSFQARFTAPAAPTKPVVVSELLKPRPRTERAVLVGLSADPMRLFAWDLQRGLLWEREVQASSAPLIAADCVVLQEHDGVVVRELQTGAVRERIEDAGQLVGADGEGDRIVITLAAANKAKPGAVYLLDKSGVRWKQQLNLPVGVAALSGAYVSVPWATQRLSILDAATGLELERLHFKSSVIGHAIVEGGRLYIGQHGLLPVTRELLEHPGNKQTPYAPFKRSLPAQPALLRDGYAPVADPDNAQHRLQLTWRLQPSTAGESRTENDLVVLRFYRLLIALDANSDEVRWVRSFEHDLVAAAVEPGGVFVVDTRGTLRALDLQGNTRAQIATGRGLRVAALRPASTGPSLALDAAIIEPIQPLLREQLAAAAHLADDRLGLARAYAVTQLAHSNDAEVTAQLIELCSVSTNPEPMRSTACAALRERSSGEGSVLAALRVRASFLEGTEAPPVGPLAQAAAKMQLKQAGSLLVSHIEDPNTPAHDLVAVFAAVQSLHERTAAASIERFVRLHHAEPDGSELLPALTSALNALGALRMNAQRPTLLDVANDELTPKSTRDSARAALAALDAPAAPSAPTAAEAPVATAAVDEVQTDPRPYALTQEVVRKTLAPLRQQLSRCLATDATHPHSGRTSLVIDAAGSVEGVFVLPATLQPCVEPLLRTTQFPKTRLGRQRVTHVFAKVSGAKDK